MSPALPCPGCLGPLSAHVGTGGDSWLECESCHWYAEGPDEPATLDDLLALESWPVRDVDLARWTLWVVDVVAGPESPEELAAYSAATLRAALRIRERIEKEEPR